MNRYLVGFLAILGGGFLAGMIGLNANLSMYTSPLVASWVAHGVGAVVALLLVGIIGFTRSSKASDAADVVDKSKKSSNRQIATHPSETSTSKAFSKSLSSKWIYLGGIPGAATVVLAAVTVNSELGLTGTIVLSIVGQTIFGMACDQFGWFGLRKRPLNKIDLVTVTLTVSGSFLVVIA